MPINKREFENGKLHSKVEEEIIFFLDERKERAFTSQEIMEGIRYHTEFSTPEISKISTFAIADFTVFLHHLVEKQKIKTKIVRGRVYFMAARNGLAKCPKCEQVVEPEKTWRMAGRPNRRGEKLQLHIGFFKCPKHGAFRTVLGKQKIPAHVDTRTPTRKKRTRKKKPTYKKKAKQRDQRQRRSRQKRKREKGNQGLGYSPSTRMHA